MTSKSSDISVTWFGLDIPVAFITAAATPILRNLNPALLENYQPNFTLPFESYLSIGENVVASQLQTLLNNNTFLKYFTLAFKHFTAPRTHSREHVSVISSLWGAAFNTVNHSICVCHIYWGYRLKLLFNRHQSVTIRNQKPANASAAQDQFLALSFPLFTQCLWVTSHSITISVFTLIWYNDTQIYVSLDPPQAYHHLLLRHVTQI